MPPFISQILNFIYWTVLIFILIYFEWRDTENQQYERAVILLVEVYEKGKEIDLYWVCERAWEGYHMNCMAL